MVIIDYIDEGTMKQEKIQVSDEQFKISTDLHKIYSEKYNCTDIIRWSDRKTLSFGVSLIDRTLENRLEFELGKHTYPVFINSSEFDYWSNKKSK